MKIYMVTYNNYLNIKKIILSIQVEEFSINTQLIILKVMVTIINLILLNFYLNNILGKMAFIPQ